MSATRETGRPVVDTDSTTQLEDMFQVVIFNDDVNTMEHVVKALMQVFAHPEALAVKIMLEAHHRGKAIAEVEGETLAKTHRDQLQSYGLIAVVEKV
jgi:ATP-dependent Clp protease adaptor protein ClpS